MSRLHHDPGWRDRGPVCWRTAPRIRRSNVATPVQSPWLSTPRKKRPRWAASRWSNGHWLFHPRVEALESRMLLSAGHQLLGLSKLPEALSSMASPGLAKPHAGSEVQLVASTHQTANASSTGILRVTANGMIGSPIESQPVVIVASVTNHTTSLNFSPYGSMSSFAPAPVSSPGSASISPGEVHVTANQQVTVPAPLIAAQSQVTVPGVSVGPLVSLGSAPLRPPLGTTAGNPTPAINRAERAFDLITVETADGSNAEFLLGLTTNGSDGPREDTATVQSTRSSGPLITSRGPGGQLAMVSSLRTGQYLSDPTAVLATLPSEDHSALAQQQATAPVPPAELDTGALACSEEPSGTDFVRAACGLMLGIGLTTGPLYPDLMPLVRKLLPRRVCPSSPTGRGSTGQKTPLRSLKRWLGLC